MWKKLHLKESDRYSLFKPDKMSQTKHSIDKCTQRPFEYSIDIQLMNYWGINKGYTGFCAMNKHANFVK